MRENIRNRITPNTDTFHAVLLLFLLNIGISSYEDDSTPDAMNKSTNEIVPDIKMAPECLFTWFRNNSMKADKLHYIITDTDF